jgi:hypothetical protein
MRRIYHNIVFTIIASLCFARCSQHEYHPDWKPDDGYISNEASAAKVAEIVWLNVYGTEIEDNKPFKVKLIDGKVWSVEGVMSKGELGGVPYIEIQKSDGKILKVLHGK